VVEGSALLECALDGEDRRVLTGGGVQVVGEGTLTVTVRLPGVEVITLTSQGAPEEGQPQAWRFTYAQDKRMLCTSQLVATFEVMDERGERASVSARVR
jgi:hypothetical protein